MATTELDVRSGGGLEESADVVVPRMKAALAALDDLSSESVRAVRKDADVMHAAARRAKAGEIEEAAAKLRLYAERRLGEIFLDPFKGRTEETLAVKRSFTAKELSDFEKLAQIPRSWKRPSMDGVVAAIVAGKPSPKQKFETFDLFAECVDHQLRGRSHTPRAVILCSRQIGSTPTKYRWLEQSWDKSWVFWYLDPTTKRHRSATCEGTMDDALRYRAELSGKIAPTTPLLPVRGGNNLSLALDSVRRAREAIAAEWSSLNQTQKNELDGAYGSLDDLASGIVRATNLG